MEEKIYINQLSNYMNQEIITDFLVTQKDLRQGTKDFYLRLKLADKTGAIPANVWNNAKVISDKFKEGDILKIKGVVISYKNQTQLTVNKVRVLADEEFEIADFIAATSKDINKLSEKLYQYVDGVTNNHLQQLLKSIFDDKEFFGKFAQAPAAKGWHHNYVGGLLEHSVTVANICEFTSRLYPADRDLLITGALLHDAGKVFEYSMKSAIDFTPVGRLVGHIPLGDQLVCEKAAQIDNFPSELLMKLRHLILAHHGEYEKASARLPQTIEAVILHHADNMDAQTIGVSQLIESVQNDEAEWSEFDRLNNRYYYIK